MTITLAADPVLTPLYVVAAYLLLLVFLGLFSHRFFRGTSADFFVASRSIGPFMLLMSVFGTTMTAFALVGSTAKAYDLGIGVYGLMASWSGLIHSACFFLVGIKLWAVGKRYGYVTQCQYFRDRFESPALGYILFPILVLLVIPYLIIGLLGAGFVMRGLSVRAFPDVFPGVANPATGQMMYVGAIPPWLTMLIIAGVVLIYVFFGGVRSTAWANTFQTLVFMATGIVAFSMIARAIDPNTTGLWESMASASRIVEQNPDSRALLAREGKIGQLQFLSYMFIPLSVGMFPHLFQHWLTARSAKTFRLTVVAHPLCIMIVWIPCILIGIWAAGYGMKAPGGNSNAILGKMVAELVHNPYLTGLLIAGILAAIMSSLDSQFMCLGTMFTNDVVRRGFGADYFSDRQIVWMARGFIVAIVAVTYLLALGLLEVTHIFNLGVWCFSGFASLFPLAYAAVYWKRTTRAGAIACVTTTALVWLVLFYRDMSAPLPPGDREEMLIGGLMPVAFIFAASVAALVVVSLLTRPPSQATLDKFFTRMPADECQPVAR